MYLTHTKTMFIEALQETFGQNYPDEKLRDIHVSMEYPIEEQNYPSVWVDYEDAGPLSNMGIAHVEEEVDDDGDPTGKKLFRWQFSGWISITVMAFSSLERDLLYDAIVRAVAFGRANPSGSIFRDKVENNDLVALTLDWDKINPRGAGAGPGTMWETDEVIYERSMALQLIGEFVSDPYGEDLYNLSKIIWEGYYDEDDFNRPLGPGDYEDMDPIVSGQVPRE